MVVRRTGLVKSGVGMENHSSGSFHKETEMSKEQIWITAYDEAIADGFSAFQAGIYADAVVRSAV